MKTAAEVNHDTQVAAIKQRVLAAQAEVRDAILEDSISSQFAAIENRNLETLLVFAKLSNPGLFALVQEVLRGAA
jgi:hypothetical protein